MGKQELLYKYPPDLLKAQKHRLAKRIFKGVQKDPSCQECECCDRKIGVEIVESSCCYDKNQLAFLGPGIPLLFAYIRNTIILLLAFTLIFSGFCFYSNFSSSYCKIDSTNCEYNIFNTISLANKINNSDLLSIQNYILLAFVVVNIFLFQFFRYNFRQIEEQCDDIINSPSDYAIILRRLPENISKEDIEKMVDERRLELTEQEKQKTDNLKIDHIVLSYAMGEYTKIKQQNNEKLKKLIDQEKLAQFKPEPFPKLTQTAKLAIIVFSRQQAKQFFLYKPSIPQKMLQLICDPCTPLSNFAVKGERVSIERAPQPDDVVWENSKISISGGIMRKCLFNVLGFIVLGAGGVAQYGLAVLQNTVTNDTEKQIYSIGLSILVSIFNFIILQFLVFSSHKERNQTLTEFNTVLTVKISLFQFLNTGIFVVLANFFADMSNFKITDTLPSDVTIVMLTNAITPNISLWALNYFEITGKIFRWLVRTEKMKVTQMEANQIWESPPPQIPYKYAYILKTIWLTAFYAPLVPVVVPISMVGLTLNYFIEKHLYRYVYSVPNMLSSMVNDSAVELMEYFPLIMSLGEFIIYIYMKNYDVVGLPENWSIPIYISMAISFLNLALPMDELNKCFKLKGDDKECPPYDKVEDKFQVTYEMTNPAYQCQKKRKRDVFLFNHIFGGEGKSAAINMTGFLGLNQTGRSMVRDPLLNKNSNQEQNNNFLMGLIEQNDQIPVDAQLKPGDTTMNTTQEIMNKSLDEEANPFAAFMKLSMNKNVENPYKETTLEKTQGLKIASKEGNQIKTQILKQEEIQISVNLTPNVKTTEKNQASTDIKKGTASQVKQSNKIKQPIQAIPLQIKEQNMESDGNKHLLIPEISQDRQKNEYKDLTKDLNFKYNNSNPTIPISSTQATKTNREQEQKNKTELTEKTNTKLIASTQVQVVLQVSAQTNPSQTQTVSHVSAQTNPSQTQTVPHVSAQTNPSQTQMIPHVSAQTNPSQTQTVPQVSAQTNPSQTQTVPHVSAQTNPSQTQTVPHVSAQTNPSQTQTIPQVSAQTNPSQTQTVSHVSAQTNPSQTQTVSHVSAQTNPSQTQTVPQVSAQTNSQFFKAQDPSKVNSNSSNSVKPFINSVSNSLHHRTATESYEEKTSEAASCNKNYPNITVQPLEKIESTYQQQSKKICPDNKVLIVANPPLKSQEEAIVQLPLISKLVRAQDTIVKKKEVQLTDEVPKKRNSISRKTEANNLYNDLVTIKQTILPTQPVKNQQTSVIDEMYHLNQSRNVKQANSTNQLNRLSNLPYKYPNQRRPSIDCNQKNNTTPLKKEIEHQNLKISQLKQINKPQINNFIDAPEEDNQMQNPHLFEPTSQVKKQADVKIPLLTRAEKVQKKPEIQESLKTKSAVSQGKTFAQLFPNLKVEKQISKKVKKRFLEHGSNQLKYQNKKFTKTGAVFFQSPEITPKSNFPHVQIHVPGIKPVNELDELLRSSGRRSFGRSKDAYKQSQQKQVIQKMNNDDFKPEEIYNPRFIPKLSKS